MSEGLRRLGAEVSTGADYIVINPPVEMMDATIDTYGDHRIAMAFSLASFGSGRVTIDNPAVTAKTYPHFFEDFAKITH